MFAPAIGPKAGSQLPIGRDVLRIVGSASSFVTELPTRPVSVDEPAHLGPGGAGIGHGPNACRRCCSGFHWTTVAAPPTCPGSLDDRLVVRRTAMDTTGNQRTPDNAP